MFRTDLFRETSADALMASAYVGAPLIVDSFAGGGGASTGIEMALGRSPDIAINHNPEALALHAANHPETHHLSENVYRVDPLDHLKGKDIGLAWFSPDCKHFSKAKGGKPVERNIRDLCWIIPGWIERIQKSGGRVDVVIMENVEEFKDYGPLVATDRGLMPDPERRGENFEKWCKKLRRLGGKIEFRELRACDYGAPTIRKRLFVIIRFDGEPIVWPEPTHGKPEDPDVISGKKLPWRTAAECIDWSLPCPSIFDTSVEIWAKHQLRAVRPLADATMARVARGMKRYVLDAERPFLVQTGYGERAGQAPRAMSVDDPLGTAVAGGIKHAVVAPSVIRFNTGATGQDAREPLSTVTANGFIKRPGGAAPLGVIAPVLTAAQHGGKVRSIEDPTHTIAASRKDQNGVAVAFMAQHNNDSRRIGGVNPGRAADEPLSTATQSGSQQGIVSAFVARQFGTSTGHSLEGPSATVMADGGGKSQLVMPYLQAYYGTGDGQHETEPMRTVTTKDRHGHVEATICVPPFTEAQADRARQVASFMRAHGFWDDRELVTVEILGETFVIVDIGMRMLTPRELFNAQGFPSDYIIDGAWNYQADGAGPVWHEFSKSVQVSCVGNSVSPPVACALVSANCSHLIEYREAAE
ncbi:DNA cytosine methyltransferase [Sinorhizobium meliloti]|uniref:DNA cytosine methyltransferase n=1 Tax=Rhizobium meliloti TaxID=382 RepID=UPI000B49A9EE|nr:DNA cytosine methyltransferase [Sinorhizobium meliloti]ASP90776.1 C-5 cytosine-specific DNA methylase [Sinorhizobium meliloti]MQX60121.1 C-5 cytosine-specific DNA methylase [Sinorhizobium meliloti]